MIRVNLNSQGHTVYSQYLTIPGMTRIPVPYSGRTIDEVLIEHYDEPKPSELQELKQRVNDIEYKLERTGEWLSTEFRK